MSVGIPLSRSQQRPSILNGVLIVDDKKNIRDALCEFVAGMGLPVFGAEDHIKAMETFHAHRESIGLIITDLKMDARNVPDSAGAQLIKTLRKEGARCRIGVYTGYGEMHDQADKLRDPQVAFYLPKAGDVGYLDVIERHVRDALGDYPLAVRSNGYGDWQQIAGLRSGSPVWTPPQSWTREVGGNPPSARLCTTLRFELGEVCYRTVATADGVYIDLAGQGLRALGRPGTPALPINLMRLALPRPMADLSATIDNHEWVDLSPSCDWFGVLPIPEPRIEGRSLRYLIRKAYSQPNASLCVGKGSINLDGVACATLALCPFHYEPRTRVFQMLKSARVRVSGRPLANLDFAASVLTPEPSSLIAHQILGWPGTPSRSLDAPGLGTHGGSNAGDGGRGSRSGGSGHSGRPCYLAVGTAETLAAVSPLLDARAKAFDVRKCVIGQDCRPAAPSDASPDGRAVAMQGAIQRFVESLDRRVQYILLVGGDLTIPYYRYERYLYCGWDPDNENRLHGVRLLSDLWYAGFDRDSKSPKSPGFAIGRLPFDDIARLRAYSEHVAGPSANRPWRHWLFLCGSAQPYPRNIEDVLLKYENTHPRTRGWVTGPAITTPIDLAHIERRFGEGPSLATFRGHGQRSAWSLAEDCRWPDEACSVVSLGGLNGIVSIACCTAAPDEPVSGCGACEMALGCTQQTPLGISALDAGVAWFLGSTRPSFTDQNDLFHDALMEEICSKERESGGIGDAHLNAILKVLGGLDAEFVSGDEVATILDTAATSILLGDPAAPIGMPP